MPFRLTTLSKTVMAAAAAGLAAAGLAWLWVQDPKINFLPAGGPAHWIVFPAAPFGATHPVVPLDTVFRRQFTLDQLPSAARLRVRAAKRFELEINGRRVEIVPGRNWKELATAEVLSLLRQGTNTLQVTVYHDNGPPALWLALAMDRLTLASDRTWEASCAGSAWRRAALASDPKTPGRATCSMPVRERSNPWERSGRYG